MPPSVRAICFGSIRNTFYWNGRHGIHFRSGDTPRIQDNDFTGTVPGTLAAIHVFNQHGAVIAQNRFEDEPSTIGTPYRSIVVESSYYTTIASNYWTGAGHVDYSISLTGENPTQVVRLIGNMWGAAARQGAVELVTSPVSSQLVNTRTATRILAGRSRVLGVRSPHGRRVRRPRRYQAPAEQR